MQMMFICNYNYVRIQAVYSLFKSLNIDRGAACPYDMFIVIITYHTVWRTRMDTGKQRREQLKKEGTLHPNPEKVRTELVAQSPFFDAHDLMQMKYEMLRSVSADHQPAAAAARSFGLSRVAYYHARRQYESRGLAGLLPGRRGPKHPHKFNPEVMAFIDAQLAATGGLPDWRPSEPADRNPVRKQGPPAEY